MVVKLLRRLVFLVLAMGTSAALTQVARADSVTPGQSNQASTIETITVPSPTDPAISAANNVTETATTDSVNIVAGSTNTTPGQPASSNSEPALIASDNPQAPPPASQAVDASAQLAAPASTAVTPISTVTSLHQALVASQSHRPVYPQTIQATREGSVSVAAQSTTQAPAPASPPTMPGGYGQFSQLLGSATAPAGTGGFGLSGLLAGTTMASRTLLLFVALILAVTTAGQFVSRLRRSGYVHAARSDAATLNFVTPPKVSLNSAPWALVGLTF